MRHVKCLILFVTCFVFSDPAVCQETRRSPLRSNPGGVRATVEFYQSKMDGKRRPYGLCITNDSKQPKPLIVQLQPGLSETVGNPSRAFQQIERVIDIARKHGQPCVAIRPTGRGPGSLFQNYGEVDVLEAIADVSDKMAIDPNRITLFGHSMGGAGVFYMTSHYPDRFAGAVPMSGYCDYRLWAKPGGHTYFMPPWEEPSWQGRSAALLAGNLQHTPLWMIHGAWDRGVGSGVSVEHSRQMTARLRERDFPVKYTELPQTGHHVMNDALFEDIVQWLLAQKKQFAPRHVSLTTYSLRHNRSYWVAIEQFQHYGQKAGIDARITRDGSVTVQTENLRAFSLGPLPGQIRVAVRIGDQNIIPVDLTHVRTFRRQDSTKPWRQTPDRFERQKRPTCAGPISDLFFENVILVAGSSGTEEENYFNQMAVYNLRNMFRRTNGGLHRGGIPGENSMVLPFAVDTDLSDEAIRDNNLLLFGTPATNRLLQRFQDYLSIEFGPKTVTLGDRTYRGDHVAVFAVFPHPENQNRYIGVHGGVTPDATTFGSHLNALLLPDYLVYNGPDLLSWGFFNNQWK